MVTLPTTLSDPNQPKLTIFYILDLPSGIAEA